MGEEMKPGDKVKIRQWDDMAQEFGVDKDGDINSGDLLFLREMRPLCGTEVEVLKVEPDGVLDVKGCDEWFFNKSFIEE
jgi:hypothetical protein